jgi:formyl-CoA transferase
LQVLYAASILAQFGAEVIKVEPPGEGDPLRKWRKLHDGTSLWWYSQSRNKKSVTLDLKTDAAREIVRKLVPTVDIVIENFRPGTLEKWGLGWEDLQQIKPSLIMVRISGYGQDGPTAAPRFCRHRRMHGWPALYLGFPDRPPGPAESA